jgi:hypothetical protein
LPAFPHSIKSEFPSYLREDHLKVLSRRSPGCRKRHFSNRVASGEQARYSVVWGNVHLPLTHPGLGYFYGVLFKSHKCNPKSDRILELTKALRIIPGCLTVGELKLAQQFGDYSVWANLHFPLTHQRYKYFYGIFLFKVIYVILRATFLKALPNVACCLTNSQALAQLVIIIVGLRDNIAPLIKEKPNSK